MTRPPESPTDLSLQSHGQHRPADLSSCHNRPVSHRDPGPESRLRSRSDDGMIAVLQPDEGLSRPQTQREHGGSLTQPGAFRLDPGPGAKQRAMTLPRVQCGYGRGITGHC
ncbi:hypothetical protein AAFF_G00213230 [Aldrovandia affinis]|uniref:Uncharacterized protein n=1 Tax=Aldrovandia affinis TaxID=143900 RepID=A0AAD7W5U3_9TELE|nr:hypothetical protein AAFF_G00213230 [Aldrovandia affinis]